MRPIVHPPLESLSPQGILHALSDPERVAIFAEIAASECVERCSALSRVAAREIPKSSLSQHFKILREAGLIRSERVGVEMRNYSRCSEVEARFPGLIPAILSAYSS
jgi:DNA-binding transcriptional ArsR family regulator